MEENDDFFGSQDETVNASTTTARFASGDVDYDYADNPDSFPKISLGQNEFGELMQRERVAKKIEVKNMAYLDAYDEYKDSRLQEGFEFGMRETFDSAFQIGRMLGSATTLHALSHTKGRDSNAVERPMSEETIGEVTNIARDFFTHSFQKDDSKDCKEALGELRNKLKTLLRCS